MIKKGDYLVPFADDVIMLYDGLQLSWRPNIKKIYRSKRLKWVILDCKLFEYAKQSKSFRLTALFVDLLEEVNLHCWTLRKGLQESSIPVPLEFHCSSCPCLAVRADSAR